MVVSELQGWRGMLKEEILHKDVLLCAWIPPKSTTVLLLSPYNGIWYTKLGISLGVCCCKAHFIKQNGLFSQRNSSISAAQISSLR